MRVKERRGHDRADVLGHDATDSRYGHGLIREEAEVRERRGRHDNDRQAMFEGQRDDRFVERQGGRAERDRVWVGLMMRIFPSVQ